MKYSSIIMAAGSGKRMGINQNKILLEINGKIVIDYSVDYFKNDSKCGQVIVVCSVVDYESMRERYDSTGVAIVVGGETRQESVYKGLNEAIYDFVIVHDAARPYLVREVIDRLLLNVIDTKASTLAVFVKDTIVEVDGNRLIKALDRSKVVSIQTPQAFETKLLLDAHEKARKASYFATDDTQLVSKFTNVNPAFVEGDYRCIKLTTKEDLDLLKVIL
jgi:2-C-methyl-D-erythritol 4-phosphate cytidylyltransferase